MDPVYQKLYDENLRVRSPLFPSYSQVKSVLPVWAGCKKSDITQMINILFDLTGTPQDTMDWTDPDTWLHKRLSGEPKELAIKTWEESNKNVNPRYSYNVYLFINKYVLLEADPVTDIYSLTERGQAFLNDNEEYLKHIDELEGIPKLLSIISEKQPAKRSDFIENWAEYLKENSKFGTKSTISDTLSKRLKNLLDRNLLERNGNYYSVTKPGDKKAATVEAVNSDPKRDAIKAIKAYNEQQKQAFLERLMKITPYQFEEFVGQLLDALEYQEVQVTKQSGDKGIDVVGKAQFGVTEILDVVQVKRTKSTITRPVLDQLRGAAQLHDAQKGTIITLGKFAKGCKDAALYPRAMPVTLIDGDKLFEILKEHEIGVHKSEVTLIDFDEKFLKQFEEIDNE